MGIIINPYRYGSGGGSGPPIANATYLDSGDKASTVTLTNSNLTATKNATTAVAYALARHGKTSGKWRFQCTIGALPGTITIGVVGPTFTTRSAGPGGLIDGVGLDSHNGAFQQGTSTAVYDPGDLAVSDVIDCYVDLDASPGLVWYAKNGTVLSGDPAAGTGGLTLGTTEKAIYPCVNLHTASSAVTFNFGATAWTHTGISGFAPWDDNAGVTYAAWRSIRMYIRSTGFFAHAFAEWEVMASSGGANILSGATMTSSHSLVGGSGALSALVDGTTSTWAGVTSGGGAAQSPVWFEADKGSSATRSATHLAVRGRDGGGGGEAQAPTLFDVWISTDDTVFHKGGTGYTFSAFAGTTPGERKELTL